MVGVVYLVIGAAVVAFATVTLTADIDARLTQAFDRVPPDGFPAPTPGAEPPSPGRDPGRPHGLPFLVWFVAEDGTIVTGTETPDLPAELLAVTGPSTATIDGTAMRVTGRDVAAGRVVVAQSMEQVSDAQRTIVVGWLLIAPFLLGFVFVGAVIVGRRVAEPIEAARRRQLEFTADASHELRTPLSVIEAHTSLALAQERDATWYRGAFGRVDRESKRMRRLLEDMLWLARFDAAAAPHADGARGPGRARRAGRRSLRGRRGDAAPPPRRSRPGDAGAGRRVRRTCWTGSSACCSTTRASTRRRRGPWTSRSPPRARGPPSPWTTPARASPTRTRRASSTASTAPWRPPRRPGAPASAWRSATRSCARRAAAGRWAGRRPAVPAWP